MSPDFFLATVVVTTVMLKSKRFFEQFIQVVVKSISSQIVDSMHAILKFLYHFYQVYLATIASFNVDSLQISVHQSRLAQDYLANS